MIMIFYGVAMRAMFDAIFFPFGSPVKRTGRLELEKDDRPA